MLLAEPSLLCPVLETQNYRRYIRHGQSPVARPTRWLDASVGSSAADSLTSNAGDRYTHGG